MKSITVTILALILTIPLIFRKRKPVLQTIWFRRPMSPKKDEYVRYDIDDFLT